MIIRRAPISCEFKEYHEIAFYIHIIAIYIPMFR